MSVLSTPEHFTPVTYLDYQGEPTASMPAYVCAINTWTLHTCDIPGLPGRTHCQHAGLCLCYQHLNTSHLWRTWFSRENPLWRHMLACVCAINTWTLHTCDVPGSAGRTHCDTTCRPVSVLSTPEHFTPVTYLVQQGEPIGCHMPACVCAINTWTLHTCDVPGSAGRTHCDATCQPVSVLLTV